MNELTIGVITQVVQVIVPLAVTWLGGQLAMGWNSILKQRAEGIKNEALKQQVLTSFQIDQTKQEFLQQKAIEAIRFAYEKHHQSWKDNDVKEMTSGEKLLEATKFMSDNLSKSGVSYSFTTEEVAKKIESVLPQVRPELDAMYNGLQTLFLKRNEGIMPQNSTTIPVKTR